MRLWLLLLAGCASSQPAAMKLATDGMAGHHERVWSFVALGEDVEEEFSTGFRQWYEAEFVDDQELHFVE